MKVRDSGMPEEEMWAGFFDPAKALAILGLDRSSALNGEKPPDFNSMKGISMTFRPTTTGCFSGNPSPDEILVAREATGFITAKRRHV